MIQCMQESLMMIPDCHSKLEKAVKDLKNLYEDLEKEYPESKEVIDAKNVLDVSVEHLNAE